MNNKNAFYTCPYCNEEYTEPSDLAHCILNCETKIKAAEEAKQKAQKEAEKKARKKEVDDAIANCKTLIKSYMDDYGIYSFASCDDGDIFGSKFWNWIW